MKRGFAFCVFAVIILTGCSRNARLYPVQGPLASQTPMPVYVAKLSGALNSGTFTATLENGDVYSGRWSVVPQPKAPKGQIPVTNPSAGAMSAEWDAVYGSGYYVAHVLGARLYARAELKSGADKILKVEMYQPPVKTDETGINIKGVAKDSNGNIFKVAF